MVIVMDAREFAPGRMTGIRRHLEGLVAGIAEARPEWRIFLLVNTRSDTPSFGCRTAYLREPERLTLFFDQSTTHRIIRENKADLYYSPYFKVPLFTRVPVISTIHDIMDIALPSCRLERGRLRSALLSLMIGKYLKASRRVTCDSEFTLQEVFRHYPGLQGFREKFSVLPLDYRPPRAAPATLQSITAQYPIRPPYLLYTGNFKPHKKVPLLIKAWKALRDAGGWPYSLVLAGGGGADDLEVSRQAEVLGPGVCVVRRIPEPELQALYAHASLLVHPSVYEGFGYPVVEAFNHGIPVCLCRASSLPEIGGDAAVYFEPDSVESLSGCLRSLMGNPAMLAELARKGRERLGLYTAGRFRDGFIRLAEQATGEKN